MKPKIFVSSTIIDFEDLRSSLKYYLEEFGYDVQMSEYPNFSIDTDKTIADACIQNLIGCQYFILLIGYRRGSWYKKNELSVTHYEYRAARALIEKGHPLRIISFIRKPIWLLKDDRKGLANHFNEKSSEISTSVNKTGTTVIDDPEYLFNFINEVSDGIKFPGSESPANNWIISFDQFEDILIALKSVFHISETLKEKKLKRLLLNELENNRNKFLYTVHGMEINQFLGPYKFNEEHMMKYLAKTYYPKFFDKKNNLLFIENGIILDKTDANRLALIFSIILPYSNVNNLETRFLNKAIDEGLFLSYSNINDDYDSNLLSHALLKLLDWINSLKNIFTSEFYEKFKKEMAIISTDHSLFNSSVHISMESCAFILGLLNGERIFELSNALISALDKDDYKLLNSFNFSDLHYYQYL